MINNNLFIIAAVVLGIIIAVCVLKILGVSL